MKVNRRTKFTAFFVVVIACAAFLISGVLASTSISVNSNNGVTLGAGAAYSATCDSDISVTPLTTFNATTGAYQLTTISVSDIGNNRITGGPTSCAGKVLNLAFLHTSGNKFASWTLPADNISNKFDFGGTSGGSSGTTYFATATFSALPVAGLSSIALSIN